MKYEITWTRDDEPIARRVDKQPLTPQDRAEVKQLLGKMMRHEACWNCGREWTETKDIHSNAVKVCWGRAQTV